MDRQRVKAVVSALILGTLLPIVDMGTDFYTCISLYVSGNPIWATLVLTFIWTPSILFILNRKFLPLEGDEPRPEMPLSSILLKAFLWPFYSLTVIVTNFYLFVTSQHAEFDETKIVEEIKIAETGFESAPQAVMQLYLSFSFKRIDKTEFTTDRLFKGFSIALSITSLCTSTMKIIEQRKIESGFHNKKIFRIIHAFSTIMASLILWATLAFFLEAWTILALIICYVTTYLLIALDQKFSGPEDTPWKGIINWFGDPPFFWVSAYIIGVCLPRKGKTASILGTAVTLGLFSILIQKCVILVDPQKYSSSNNTIEQDNCTSQDFNGEDMALLWTPFVFVGLWLMIDLCTMMINKNGGWFGLEYLAQILFSFFLVGTILLLI